MYKSVYRVKLQVDCVVIINEDDFSCLLSFFILTPQLNHKSPTNEIKFGYILISYMH
jgi:hypothetical protein